MKKKDKRLKKSGLTQEQLDCLDEHIIKYVNPSLTWYFNQEDKKNGD